MSIIGLTLYWVLQLFFYAMIIRFIAELVMSVNRAWRPKGLLLPVFDLCYSVTDPPLKFARRFIPPLRLGPIALDLAWTVLLIAVLILQSFARGL
jgi:YggT family protein